MRLIQHTFKFKLKIFLAGFVTRNSIESIAFCLLMPITNLRFLISLSCTVSILKCFYSIKLTERSLRFRITGCVITKIYCKMAKESSLPNFG